MLRLTGTGGPTKLGHMAWRQPSFRPYFWIMHYLFPTVGWAFVLAPSVNSRSTTYMCPPGDPACLTHSPELEEDSSGAHQHLVGIRYPTSGADDPNGQAETQQGIGYPPQNCQEGHLHIQGSGQCYGQTTMGYINRPLGQTLLHCGNGREQSSQAADQTNWFRLCQADCNLNRRHFLQPAPSCPLSLAGCK